MVDNGKQVRKQIFDVIGGIAAFLTVVVFLLLVINAKWAFIPEGSFVMNVLNICKTWAPLVVVAIVGLEFVSTKHFVFRILFYVMMALVVISMFFPSTWEQVVGFVNRTTGAN
ncbi:MAG: hypothetical protein IJ538_03055 [Clostridia bacterium]|nr:hypothetical protein [Clostridia bacterium]